MPKINPNPSPLDALSEEQKQQLLAWLELHSPAQVVKKVAAPPPDGFGLITYPTSLKRFHTRHLAETRSEDLELARLFAPDSPHPREGATESLLLDWAFQIASRPRRNVGAFKALSRWVLKQREHQQRDKEIDLIMKRLAFDREKFEFNVARKAILLHVEIAKIVGNGTLDSENKIRAARDLFFGAPNESAPAEQLSQSSAPPPDPDRGRDDRATPRNSSIKNEKCSSQSAPANVPISGNQFEVLKHREHQQRPKRIDGRPPSPKKLLAGKNGSHRPPSESAGKLTSQL